MASGLASVPFAWYAVRKRPELFNARGTLEADGRGIRLTSAFGSGNYPWTAFRRVRERGGYLFFDSGVGPNLFIPLQRLPPADAEALRALVALYVGGHEAQPAP